MKSILFLIIILLSGCSVKRNVFHNPHFFYDDKNYTIIRVNPETRNEDIAEYLKRKNEKKITPPPSPSDTSKGIKAYDTPPKPKRIVKPVYPSEVKSIGYQGTVILQFLIDSTGVVKKAKALTFLTHENYYIISKNKTKYQKLLKQARETKREFNEIEELLAKSALAAAIQTEFMPAYHEGKPVPVWVSFPVSFILDYKKDKHFPARLVP
ncbi:hypothetical protein ES703_05805 [subsurface metagenome]